MSNSFLQPIDEFHFGTYKPEDVESALDHTEKLAWKRLEALLAVPDKDRTFENTVLAFSESTEEFETVTGVVGHLEGVLGEPWSEAVLMVSERNSKLASAISFHEGLYKALVAVQGRGDYAGSLSRHQQKVLHDAIKAYERNGIALPEEKRTELKEIRLKLSKATTEFGQNTVKVNDQTGVLVEVEADLDGLSQETIGAFRDAAIEKKQAGFWVGFNEPNYHKIMSECRVRATRRSMYEAVMSRGAELNGPLMIEILGLRRRMANLLGYKDFADYILEERMAKDGQTARKLGADLRRYYEEPANRDYRELLQFARKLEDDPTLELDISDTTSGFYYSAQMREAKVGISEQLLREYFLLETVQDKMFSTLSTLYGVTFVKADVPTWHPDVQAYAIYDEQKHHIATVLCDWFARKGKHGGAWMNEYYVADRADGSYAKPHLGYVCANFDPPTKSRPCLLTMRDVETIWHEFGHFMHLAVSRPELIQQSQFACKWDFIEAPSQIMENWVWQPEILTVMAKHYKTGESLPDETLKKLFIGRAFEVATKAMRQLNLGEVDLALHIDFDADKDGDPIAYARQIKAKFCPVPVWEKDAWIATFTHIFAGGYAAAYYSYKWAEAIEADLFSRFLKEGILNPQTGRAYRDEVLAPVGEEEPQVLIKNFLGRDSSIEAMLARDGIKE